MVALVLQKTKPSRVYIHYIIEKQSITYCWCWDYTGPPSIHPPEVNSSNAPIPVLTSCIRALPITVVVQQALVHLIERISGHTHLASRPTSCTRALPTIVVVEQALIHLIAQISNIFYISAGCSQHLYMLFPANAEDSMWVYTTLFTRYLTLYCNVLILQSLYCMIYVTQMF